MTTYSPGSRPLKAKAPMSSVVADDKMELGARSSASTEVGAIIL
jgi:hypothetical protein